MRTEKITSLIFIIGLLFKFFNIPGSSLVLILSLSVMAIIYFPVGFFFFSDKTIKNQNLPLSIVSGFFLSIIPIGMLFKLQYWPGGQINLLIGSISASVILIVTLFLNSKAKENLKTYYKNMILRTAILIILSASLYFIPSTTLIKLQYRNEPEFAKIKTLYYANPNNEEYRKQHDNYFFKQDSILLDNTNQENKIKE
jgi:hypothetical protein